MDITKNNQCKMEFYFTREKIEILLKENPAAKGIIISQEIKVRQTADKEIINVVEIKATADNGGQKMRAMSIQTLESVDGCPSPPGC
ncbi:MAG: hypothetical protein QM594_18640 [Niabella sp.]